MSQEVDVIDSDGHEIHEHGGELERYEAKPPATLFGTDDPVAVIQKATVVASALADLINKQGLFSNIQGKKHVRVEGWTLLGTMLGIFPVLEYCHPVDVDGVKGYEAKVNAQTRDGDIVGSAISYCMRNEGRWSKADTYAVASMAQCVPTRARILTRHGFKSHDQLLFGEEVLAYDVDDGKTKWVPLEAVSVYRDQPVVRMTSRSFDVTCTANHSWVAGRKNRMKLVEANALDGRAKWDSLLLAAASLDGDEDVLSPDEAALLGWIATEGTVRNVKGGQVPRVHIDQSKPLFVDEIRSLLGRVIGQTEFERRRGEVWLTPNECEEIKHARSSGATLREIGKTYGVSESSISTIARGLSNKGTKGRSVGYNESVTPASERTFPGGTTYATLRSHRFTLHARLVSYLFEKAGVMGKTDFPALSTRLGPRARAAMLDAMLKGDGNHKIDGNRSGKMHVFGQRDNATLETFRVLCALEGRALGKPQFGPEPGFVRQTLRVNRTAQVKALNIVDAPNEDVWCPTTKHGTWVMELDGQVMITGNTRATSKALRGPLGFVVTMAGYEATPAEELDIATGTQATREEKPSPAKPFDPATTLGPDAPAVAQGWKGISKVLAEIDPSIEWNPVIEQAIKGLFGPNFELKGAEPEQKREAFYRTSNAVGRLVELFGGETFLSLKSVQTAFAEMFNGIVVNVKEFDPSESTPLLEKEKQDGP